MNVFDYVISNFEFLCSPLGIFLSICILCCVSIAVYTYPKNYIKAFFIFATTIFFAITVYYYCDLNNIGPYTLTNIFNFIFRFFTKYLYFLLWGTGYLPFFIIFYWISIGIVAFLSRKKSLSHISKILIIFGISIILLQFTTICSYIATFLAILPLPF